MNEKEIKRAINRRDLKNLNKFGERIKWVREQLGLMQSTVAKDLGIPTSSFNGRENGVRTINSDEYLSLADYFNDLWKWEDNNWPAFNGTKIKKITPQWLMWGIND